MASFHNYFNPSLNYFLDSVQVVQVPLIVISANVASSAEVVWEAEEVLCLLRAF